MGQSKKLNKQPSSLSPLVQLAGIRKCFDGKEVIPQLDLTINNGEFLTLLGPSGCGKTTVLRLIAGLETVDSGRIMLDNEDITHVPAENRYVNTVFQSYALFPHMTVFENVAFGLRMQKTPAAEITPRVMEALRMVQLETFAQRKPHQLSGGQQQRVAIARAVVNKPRLLLLDESLSALDYKLRKQMQNELKALQRKLGITFVFVTHDQEEALTMSDRIVVMRDGRIEQDGTPREIYEEPKNLFVAGFIGEINMFNATVIERLDEQRVRANVEGRECNIYVNFAVEPGQKLHVLLRPEDLRVEEINDDNHAEGLIGYVRERNYKGMTLESVVELENGKMVMVSEFFNEDDPDFDHSLDQKMAINWVESWEVVLADEEGGTRMIGRLLRGGFMTAIYAYLYIPIIILIVNSFNSSRFGINWQGFTTKWYSLLMNNDSLLQAAQHSLTMAVFSATFATLIGSLTAVALYRYRFRGKPFVSGMLFVVMMSPDIVMAISLLVLFMLLGIQLGFWSLLFSHITFCLPFVVVTVYSRLKGFDVRMLEAAKDLGASEFTILRKIILPLAMPAVAAGWVLSFTLSMDDVVVSSFVTGPSYEILPLKIYSMVKVGVSPEVNALATILLVLSLVMVIASQLIARDKTKGNTGDVK